MSSSSLQRGANVHRFSSPRGWELRVPSAPRQFRPSPVIGQTRHRARLCWNYTSEAHQWPDLITFDPVLCWHLLCLLYSYNRVPVSPCDVIVSFRCPFYSYLNLISEQWTNWSSIILSLPWTKCSFWNISSNVRFLFQNNFSSYRCKHAPQNIDVATEIASISVSVVKLLVLPVWGTVSTSGLYLMLFAEVGQCRYRWKWIGRALKHCGCSRWDHLDIVFRRQIITTSGFRPPSWIYKCIKSQIGLAWVRRKNLRTKIVGISSLAGTERDILLGEIPPHLQHTLWETH